MLLPFPISLPGKKPDDVHEMIAQGNALLRGAGLPDARFELVAPPEAGAAFRGAELRLILPEKSLEEMIRREAVRQAAQHGAKVTAARLVWAGAGEKAVALDAQISAGMFLASVDLKLRAVLRAGDPDLLRVGELGFDAGSGMFANMARAVLEPHLKKALGAEFSLSNLAGRRVRWCAFGRENGALSGSLRFEE
jgi:hypothetical protein